MLFEIVHEFDIPLDAIELAVISPGLCATLSAQLANIATLRQKTHTLTDGVLERVWSFQANVKVPAFAKAYVTREMLAWDERTLYDLKTHSSTWTIAPHVKPDWQKYFSAKGSYSLVSSGDGHTRRIVRGELDLKVPVVRQVAERMIVSEVKKTFEAEAATLRDLATLV